MNKIHISILTFLTILLSGCHETDPEQKPKHNIIPQPQNIQIDKGEFALTKETKLVYQGLDNQIMNMIKNIQSHIRKATGYQLQIVNTKPQTNYICFNINTELVKEAEAYILTTNPHAITLDANSSKGLFYAFQTLRNILPYELEKDSTRWVAPCMQIKDKPQFKHRGIHFDVARHFYSIDFLKKQIDVMAYYKLNVLHWHLTDDQGWRIEIKKYPRLTSVGSKRSETLVGHGANPPFQYDNKPHSGYYTQEDIKELIQYAQERFITIIPEIELPGHSLAALSAYPELGCTGGPYEVARQWGSFDDAICPGKASSYRIIEDIISEVADLFPSPIIHIGGDNCSKLRWRDCNYCQNKIKNLALQDENELEHYFIKRVQTIVEKHGKKIAGWDEIMSDSSLTNSTIIICMDNAQLKDAIHNGNTIVQSPANHLYFDHYQSDPQNHPLAIGGYTPLKDVYCYNPLPVGLTEQEIKAIKGVQANCWTEYMTSEEQLEFMLYPRLCALAEVAWTSPDQKSWPDFSRRIETQYRRLKHENINYFYEIPKPIVDNEQVNFIQPTLLEFKNVSDNLIIYYTTNGSEPNTQSKQYTQPIPINSSGTIKAINVNKNTKERSKTTIINLNRLQFQKTVKTKNTKPGLKYTYYLGRFKTVKEIQNITPSQSGNMQDTFIPDTFQKESFGIVYEGYIAIDDKGIYQFDLSSDDGSALYIGDQLVVNNDGIHSNKTEIGAIALKKGTYPVKIYYFQTTGHSNLNLQITKAGDYSTHLLPKDFLYN